MVGGMSTQRVPFENAPDMIRVGSIQFGAGADHNGVDIIHGDPNSESEMWQDISREEWEAVKAHVDSQLDDTRDVTR